LAIDPRHTVADLETGVFDGDGEPVPCAGAAEREQMPARLQHAERLGCPPLTPGSERPRFAVTELDAILGCATPPVSGEDALVA
jgi:hypothetical protein